MPHNAAAALAGLCWGLALGEVYGFALAMAGAVGFAASLSGDPRRDALRGLAAGLLSQGLWFRELPAIWNTYGGHSGLALWGVLTAVQALPFALAGLLASPRGPKAAPLPVQVALALATCAALTALCPVPLDLATLFAFSHPLLWPAAILGTPILVGVVGLTGAGVATRDRRSLLVGAIWLAGAALWGGLSLPPPTLQVAIVQPNIDAFDARRASTRQDRADRLLSLLRKAKQHGAAVALTPETSWPFGEAPELPLPTALGHVAEGHNRLTGTDFFDKRHLVPLAERSVLGWGTDAFTAGTGSRRLTVGTTLFAPLICFEDVLPVALREAHRDGAGPLLLATNDAWLGLGHASQKHLAASVLAAVRTGRWAARPATTGPSAIIDPRGRLHLRTEPVDETPAAGSFHLERIGVTAPRWAGITAEPWVGLLSLLGLFVLRRRP